VQQATQEFRLSRIGEIAEADALGDPSWLRDGWTGLDRDAVEDCAPTGSVPCDETRSREPLSPPKHYAPPWGPVGRRRVCG
jgi:hypothetical protein